MGLYDLWQGTKKMGEKAISTVNAISKADPQVIELVDKRMAEQDKWNDVFSTKLIELLDKSDTVRADIRKRLNQIAAASRAQEELVRAAEEHRTLTAEYQKTSAALVLAQEKFARAEGILTDADELKRRAVEYTAAHCQVNEALQTLKKASALLEEATKKLAEAEQATKLTLRNAESFAVRAEAARAESDHKFMQAQAKYESANTIMGDATEALSRASTKYAEAQQAAQSAVTAHTAAISRLDTAETILRGASEQAAEAASNQAKATEDLKRAEVMVSASENRLEEATVEKQGAEAALRKAKQQARSSAAFAAVALVAAVSICTWGVVYSVSRGQYGALAPSALTLFALSFGVYVWRKAR